MCKYLLCCFLSVAFCCGVCAQTSLVRECGQKEFHGEVPPGNYSGIVHIGGNKYAVVSDKSATDGFYIFSIDQASLRMSGMKSSAVTVCMVGIVRALPVIRPIRRCS